MKSELWCKLRSETNATLTKLPKLSSSNIHVSTSSVRVKAERRAKAKTDSNVLIIRTLVGFAHEARANTLAAENLEQMPSTGATLPLKVTIMMTTRLNPQMPTKHTTIELTLEVTTENKLWTMMMMMRKMTRYLRMLLWMLSLFWRQLNWMQLLFLSTRGTMNLTLK